MLKGLKQDSGVRSSKRRSAAAISALVMALSTGWFVLAQLPERKSDSPVNSPTMDDGDGTSSVQPNTAGRALHAESEPRVDSRVQIIVEDDLQSASRRDIAGQMHGRLSENQAGTRDQVITVENAGLFFLSEPDEARAAFAKAIESQSDDIPESMRAVTAINSKIVQSEIGNFAKDWQIDCRGDICIATIEDASLKGLDERPLNAVFESLGFEKVLWFRDYKAGSTTIFLLRPAFRYDRRASTRDSVARKRTGQADDRNRNKGRPGWPPGLQRSG